MPAKKRTTKPKRTQKQKQKQSQIVNVRLARESSKSDRVPAPIILGGGGTTSQFIPQYIQQPASSTFGIQDVRDIIKSSIQDAYRIPNVPMSPFPLSQYQQEQGNIAPTFDDAFSEKSQFSFGQIYVPKPEDFGEFSSPQEKTKSTIMENLPQPQPQASPKPESQQGQTITEEQYVSLVKPIESSFDEPSPLMAAIRPLIKQKPVPFLSPIPEEEASMGQSPSPQMTEAERLREEKRQRDREYYQANQARILAQKKAAKAAKKAAKEN